MSIIERDHGYNPSILFLHSTIVHHTIHSRNGRTPNIVGQDINNSAKTLKSYSTIHIANFITRSALISPSEANSSRNVSKRPIFSTTPERITNHEFSKLGPPSRFSPCSVPIRVFKKTDDHPAIFPQERVAEISIERLEAPLAQRVNQESNRKDVQPDVEEKVWFNSI